MHTRLSCENCSKEGGERERSKRVTSSSMPNESRQVKLHASRFVEENSNRLLHRETYEKVLSASSSFYLVEMYASRQREKRERWEQCRARRQEYLRGRRVQNAKDRPQKGASDGFSIPSNKPVRERYIDQPAARRVKEERGGRETTLEDSTSLALSPSCFWFLRSSRLGNDHEETKTAAGAEVKLKWRWR